MPHVPLPCPALLHPHRTPGLLDNHGRSLILRGVNLSGASKAPLNELTEKGGETFIGRPLNLDDGSADVHLARLKGWGFNFLRFPVAWEALERQGPGIYDEEFIDYIIRVLLKCKEYGFKVYMDPHQDTVLVPLTGGSGAPFWTLPLCGINPQNITATQAAILHSEYPTPYSPSPSDFPAMIWSTNYGRLLSQTSSPSSLPAATLPQAASFIEAFGHLADRIAAYNDGELLDECVIGWDSMNEPFEGLVGWPDLSKNPDKQGSTLKKGTYPTPAQGMRLGMGQAQEVENYKFGAFGPAKDGTVTIDPKGRRLWVDPEADFDEGPKFSKEREDGTHPRWGWKRDVSKWKLGSCIWAQHGVWDIETGYILRPDYFLFHPETGSEVEFINDYWKPHFLAFGRRIRKAHKEAILFVQPPVFAPPPEFVGEEAEVLGGRAGYSPHYYDGLTLVTRHWNWFNADALGLLRGKYSSPISAVKIGSKAIRSSLRQQLALLKSDSTILGGPGYPTIIGEIGTPVLCKGNKKGDYRNQEKALDASLQAADGGVGVGYTVWTYVPDDGSWMWGDGLWCKDDFRGENEWDLVEGVQGGESTLGLLKNQSQMGVGNGGRLAMRAITAASELSLATLGGGTLSLKGSPVPPVPPLPVHLQKRTETEATLCPPTFSQPQLQPSLSSRLRSASTPTLSPSRTPNYWAVRAFSRPWPIKVVGKINALEFDIGQACVKVGVSVSREDAVQFRQGGKESGMTEVFLPVVHFGSAEVVGVRDKEGWWTWLTGKRDQMKPVRASLESEGRATYPPAPATYPPSISSSSTISSQSSDSLVLPPHSSLLPWWTQEDLLSVEVKCSPGSTYSIAGQIMSWTYPLPEEGEEEKEVWIEVRRRGGAIKVGRDGKAHREDVGKEGWEPSRMQVPACPCPCFGEGCVIM
ncbi:glycoside hydrolase superfamily [Cyathus striatus]|nr:glycoside hydrolase superfamily [Cyathus striatus]